MISMRSRSDIIILFARLACQSGVSGEECDKLMNVAIYAKAFRTGSFVPDAEGMACPVTLAGLWDEKVNKKLAPELTNFAYAIDDSFPHGTVRIVD